MTAIRKPSKESKMKKFQGFSIFILLYNRFHDDSFSTNNFKHSGKEKGVKEIFVILYRIQCLRNKESLECFVDSSISARTMV